ncbi:MAG: hypothetical protein Q8L48_39200 [Archangium sp.]|nr:hypothetical protein [Archangium sp.]
MIRLAVGAVVLLGCAHAPATEAPMTDAPWSTIGVADGSANFHRFTRGADGRVQYAYVPVTPEQSSTGFYSGGPPRAEDLAPNDPRLVALWDLLGKLEADQSKHTPDRAKGTGAISWDGPAGKRAFIIQRGAELDGLLKLLAGFGT